MQDKTTRVKIQFPYNFYDRSRPAPEPDPALPRYSSAASSCHVVISPRAPSRRMTNELLKTTPRPRSPKVRQGDVAPTKASVAPSIPCLAESSLTGKRGILPGVPNKDQWAIPREHATTRFVYPWHAGRRAALTLGPPLQPDGFHGLAGLLSSARGNLKASEDIIPGRRAIYLSRPTSPPERNPSSSGPTAPYILRLGRRCLLACSGAGIRCLSYSRNIPKPRINSVSSGSQASRRTCFEKEAKAREGRRQGRRETEGAKSSGEQRGSKEVTATMTVTPVLIPVKVVVIICSSYR